MKLIRILAGCFFAAAIVGVVGLSVGMDYGDLSVRNLTVSGATNGVTLPQSAITNLISDLSAKLDTDSLISSTELTYTYGSDSGRYYVSAVPQSKITGLTTSDTANFYGTSTTNISTTNATIAHIYGGTAIDTPRISGSLVVDSPSSTSVPTLYVDAANNRVGIGTGAPAHPLSVEASTNEILNIKNPSTTSGNYAQLKITAGSCNAYIWENNQNETNYGGAGALNIFNGSSAPTVFHQGGLEKMRITSDGYVGIGTASPGATLDLRSSTGATAIIGRISNAAATSVPGTINFNAPNASGTARIWGGINCVVDDATNSSEDAHLTFSTRVAGNYTDIMTVGYNGNVGIGTANPGYPLEVTGNAYFSANVSALSYTDRTPYPEDTATAYAAVKSMERLPPGQYKKWDKSHQVNHDKTHEFIKTESGHRDLSATVSCQNEVIKDLIKRIETLEAKVQALEAKQ